MVRSKAVVTGDVGDGLRAQQKGNEKISQENYDR